MDGKPAEGEFPPNVIKNTKFNVLTFVPLVLYEQFKFFFNLYFLVVALTQFIPILQVGQSFSSSVFSPIKINFIFNFIFLKDSCSLMWPPSRL